MTEFWRKNFWLSKDKSYTLDALHGNRSMFGEGSYRRSNTRSEERRWRTSWLDDVKARTRLRPEKALQTAAD